MSEIFKYMINLLPEAILMEIFLNLDDQGVDEILYLSCKQWNRIKTKLFMSSQSNKTIERNMDLIGYVKSLEINDLELLEKGLIFKNLKDIELTIEFFIDHYMILNKFISGQRKLSSITLKREYTLIEVPLSTKLYQPFTSSTSQWQNITIISIYYDLLEDEKDGFISSLTSLPLKSFSFTSHKNIYGILELASVHLTDLEYIYLWGAKYEKPLDSSYKIGKLLKLKTLNIYTWDLIEDMSMPLISPQTFPSLQNLAAPNGNGIANFFAIKIDANEKWLHLKRLLFTIANQPDLDNLNNMSQLEEIKFSLGLSFNENSLKKALSSLDTFKFLTSLGFMSFYDPVDSKLIKDALLMIRTLLHLNINGNITDKAFDGDFNFKLKSLGLDLYPSEVPRIHTDRFILQQSLTLETLTAKNCLLSPKKTNFGTHKFKKLFKLTIPAEFELFESISLLMTKIPDFCKVNYKFNSSKAGRARLMHYCFKHDISDRFRKIRFNCVYIL